MAVLRDGKSVDVAVVGLDAGDELEHVGPDLESSIPSDSGEVLVLGGLGVSDSGDPVLVVELGTLHLAVSDGVPEHHLALAASGKDLSVALGEGNGVDFLLVAEEDLLALSVSEVPKSQGLVPGG